MVKCVKCTKIVNKKAPGLQCNKCSKWLHAACAFVTSEQLNALHSTESVDWKCKSCVGSHKSKRMSCILPDEEGEDNSDNDQNPIIVNTDNQQILREIRQEVREMRHTIREIIHEELQNTLKFYSEKIDDFEETIQKYESRIKLLENQCKNLNNKCNNLQLKNDVIEQKTNKIEQALVSNDVEICGIPVTTEENPKQLALKVCHLLKQEPEEIIKAYRKKVVTRKGATQAARFAVDAPIVMSLKRGCRESWTNASRTTSITTRDLGVDGNSKVYVREMLSSTTAYLLWKTKAELKSNSMCKYVWCKNGDIMVRKSEGDKKIYYVRSENDIEIIRREISK